MVSNFSSSTAVRLALVAAAAASLAACAKKEPLPTRLEPTPQAQAPQAPPPAQNTGPIGQQATGPVPGSAQDFVVNVGDRVYFDLDSHDIRADAEPILSAQAGWLRRYPSVRVRIEGNADERGTREYNLALGARRANAVRSYLVNQGISADRVSTISFGKEQPIDPGSGEEAWQKNRNGHTAIVSGGL